MKEKVELLVVVIYTITMESTIKFLHNWPPLAFTNPQRELWCLFILYYRRRISRSSNQFEDFHKATRHILRPQDFMGAFGGKSTPVGRLDEFGRHVAPLERHEHARSEASHEGELEEKRVKLNQHGVGKTFIPQRAHLGRASRRASRWVGRRVGRSTDATLGGQVNKRGVGSGQPSAPTPTNKRCVGGRY